MKEIWKNISGSAYSVSSLGRIMNDKTGQILKFWHNNHHYPCITLEINGKRCKLRVHRIVAEAFIPNPDAKPCVDHINTNRSDNRVENLRWATFKENSRNPTTLIRLHRTTFKAGSENPKTMTGKFGLENPRSIPVCQIKGGNTIKSYSCAREAMRQTGIACTTITKCCRGQRKSAGGYQWAYINRNEYGDIC